MGLTRDGTSNQTVDLSINHTFNTAGPYSRGGHGDR